MAERERNLELRIGAHTGPAPRNSEFQICFPDFPDFSGETSNLKTNTISWRLQNATCCQNVVPMGTTSRQQVVS